MDIDEERERVFFVTNLHEIYAYSPSTGIKHVPANFGRDFRFCIQSMCYDPVTDSLLLLVGKSHFWLSSVSFDDPQVRWIFAFAQDYEHMILDSSKRIVYFCRETEIVLYNVDEEEEIGQIDLPKRCNRTDYIYPKRIFLDSKNDWIYYIRNISNLTARLTKIDLTDGTTQDVCCSWDECCFSGLRAENIINLALDEDNDCIYALHDETPSVLMIRDKNRTRINSPQKRIKSN